MSAVRSATAHISSSLHCSIQHAAALMAFRYVELLCAQRRDEMINWLRFNKRCSFMLMKAWIWVSSVHWYLGAEGAEQNSPALFSLLSVTSHPYHTLTPYHRFTSSSLFFSYQLATQPSTPTTLTLRTYTAPLPHRFESPLNVDPLAPRHSGVSETVTGAASAGDVHSLPPQVPEGFRYHQNGIMGQRWSVLTINMAEKQMRVTDKKWEEEERAYLIN